MKPKDDFEWLEFRGLVCRAERIMSALLNLTDERDWQQARIDRLQKQMDHLGHMAGKLAEDMQVKMLNEGL